jgi:pyrroline-5-carboxylate reductase
VSDICKGKKFPPLALIGAGKMGGALFAGWVRAGLAPSVIVDPYPSPGLARGEDRVFDDAAKIPAGFFPAAIILAIKPQMADAVMPLLRPLLGPETFVLSIMAGKRIAGISAAFNGAPVVRAMPNTPAAIGHAVTVACCGPMITLAQRDLAESLLRAVGDAAFVDDESLIDVVTPVSGSGPAYVFLLVEVMAEAGIAAGLPRELAYLIARKTVSGSGALLEASSEDAAALRKAVTSPKGTTEKALEILMADEAWPRLMRDAVLAGKNRAAELSG